MGLHYVMDSGGLPVACHDQGECGIWAYDRRCVAVDTFTVKGVDYRVSTVFLVLDHNLSGSGPPVLWETMVFTEYEEWNNRMWRYTSLDDAKKGHKAVIRALVYDEEVP